MARIEHVALFARNPDTLKDFYVEAMGLRVIHDNGKGSPPGYFLADDAGVALEVIGRPPGIEGVNPRYACHVAFVVEDVAESRSELEGRGVVFETDSVVDNDSMVTAFFHDPEGNRIQIVHRRKPLGG